MLGPIANLVLLAAGTALLDRGGESISRLAEEARIRGWIDYSARSEAGMQEDGDPAHAGAPMGLLRLADAPIIGGASRELRRLHPDARSGPVLVLPMG